mgnify:CR=1 FL=1
MRLGELNQLVVEIVRITSGTSNVISIQEGKQSDCRCSQVSELNREIVSVLKENTSTFFGEEGGEYLNRVRGKQDDTQQDVSDINGGRTYYESYNPRK